MNKEIYALEYSDSDFSVFLAGPTPRDNSVKSWRPAAIKILREQNFKGNIFIPEKRDNHLDYEYDSHTKWEVEHLNKANVILFWIPREVNSMPAFTTNIEFGEFMHSGKIILAYPPNAQRMRYLEMRAKMHNIPIFNNLHDSADHLNKMYAEFVLKNTVVI